MYNRRTDSRVGGRLVEDLAQQLGGQVEWESGNKGTSNLSDVALA
jgi:hypothetical protein